MIMSCSYLLQAYMIVFLVCMYLFPVGSTRDYSIHPGYSREYLRDTSSTLAKMFAQLVHVFTFKSAQSRQMVFVSMCVYLNFNQVNNQLCTYRYFLIAHCFPIINVFRTLFAFTYCNPCHSSIHTHFHKVLCVYTVHCENHSRCCRSHPALARDMSYSRFPP